MHTTYEVHKMKDPSLPFIFHDFCLRPNWPSNTCNWHENIEILLVLRGSGMIQNDEIRLPVEAGDIVVINANSLHSVSSIEEMRYFCLIVDRSFCLANHFDTNIIRFDPLLRDDEIAGLIEAFQQEFTAKAQLPYRVPTLRGDVLQIMALLCRRYGKTEDKPHTDSRLLASIKQAIGYIRSESHRDLSLEDIAAFAGLSKYYFAREFRRITGYSVVSYLNLVRCEKAKAFLAEKKMTIGEIGRACGFANQSYFTRTFRTYTGQNPSEYRDRKRKMAE
ncbi:MAG: helix-turn-helix transcriptional regulator [Clostridia bacterium]|nr:helix-turn-helix transcriptional regulator [Clostridia bacterium]